MLYDHTNKYYFQFDVISSLIKIITYFDWFDLLIKQ